MINGISSNSSYYWMTAMQTQRKNPFEENDANGDGSLDVTELGAFAERMSEMTGESVDAEELLAKLDTDGDGVVSEAELEAGRPQGPPPELMAQQSMGGLDIQILLQMLSKSTDEESSTTDDTLDTNGDGSLDVTELGALAGHISETSGQTVTAEELLAQMDTDGDGAVSEAEFEAGRPQGPPPGMMAEPSTQASDDFDIQTLLKILSGSTDEESSGTSDPLDTNGDGVVDALEAQTGRNNMLQEYLKQAGFVSGLSAGSGSQFSLQV